MSGTRIEFVQNHTGVFDRVTSPGTKKTPVSLVLWWRVYRYPGYIWMGELTEVSGTGIEVEPNIPKCWAPVSKSDRTYRRVGHRYRYDTGRTKVSGTDIELLSKSDRTYRRVGHRHRYDTGRTKVSGTDIEFVPNLPKCRGPVSRRYLTYKSVGYQH